MIVCLLFFLAGQVQAITYADLKKQLRYRLAQSSPDFSDTDLEYLVVMGRVAIQNHGLASSYESNSKTPINANQQYVVLGDGFAGYVDVMFAKSVLLVSDGQQRSLLEVGLKDIGHRHLDTDVPLSYFTFFRTKDSTYIYVYPASTEQETLYITLQKCGFNSTTIIESPIFEEVWLDYALMLAYIRLENWKAAADAYNSYAQGIAILREEIMNKEPDITVAPKIIK